MALNVLKDIRRIYAGLNADEIRGESHQDVNVGLMAVSEEGYRELERFLAPAWLEGLAQGEAHRCIHRVDRTPHNRFNFVLCEFGIVPPSNGYVYNPAEPDSTARNILADNPEMELAIARVFPRFRRVAASNVIHRVSRENALFSLVTALPNVIPSVIDLPWAIGEFATDTAFLTMNQIRMALIMAAAYGQPIGYAEQKFQIGAIAAGAFGWRAVARELVGKIPLGGGLIPKAAVAFAGTYVVGLGLEKVNRTGSGLSRLEKKDAYADAFARGKEVVKQLVPSVAKKA